MLGLSGAILRGRATLQPHVGAQQSGRKPESPEHDPARVGIEAVGRHGNPNAVLVRGNSHQRVRNGEAQEASAAAGAGHIVEPSPVEQVMAAVRAATNGRSLATTPG